MAGIILKQIKTKTVFQLKADADNQWTVYAYPRVLRLWPWPWPDDLDIRKCSRYSDDIHTCQKWTF